MPSRSEIRRAGETIRTWWMAPHDAEITPEVGDAYSLIVNFRETFQDPLNRSAVGLRSMVCSQLGLPKTGASVPVTQRLKRMPQLLWKLERFPEMDLARMGDIGGCRAVLPNRDAVNGVLRRIQKNWTVKGRIRDTREQPAPSGYRALHVVVERGDRLIEVQLRTPKQNEWATTVERTGQRLGLRLKEGDAPNSLSEYFRLAAHGLYLEEEGLQPDLDFVAEFAQARERARPFFAR